MRDANKLGKNFLSYEMDQDCRSGQRLIICPPTGLDNWKCSVGSVAQWLGRITHDPTVTGSIPTKGHVVIAEGKLFTIISSVHPSAKWVFVHRQLNCIDY